MSAGMLCWFEEAITDSYGEKLGKLNGLGFLTGSACLHFDGESNRKPSYTQLIKNGGIQGGLALDDELVLFSLMVRLVPVFLRVQMQRHSDMNLKPPMKKYCLQNFWDKALHTQINSPD